MSLNLELADEATDSTERIWLWRALAVGLIVAAAAGRIYYLACACPLDLSPDEAHYWDWSRRLDWSYYSKGPVVAVLIRLGSMLFGSLSTLLTGDQMLAVRLPAVLCGSMLLFSLYVLTVQVFRRERLAAAVVAVGLTFPLLNAGAILMTIDAPFACCWGWALVLGYMAIFSGRWWAWPALGLIVGVGILAKYTMVLWFPCLALFLLTCPEKRYLLLRPGFRVMTTIVALCCLPLWLWNAQHDWVSYEHMLGHAGLHGSVSVHWLGPLIFIGGQFVLLLGFWFVAWVEALWARGPWRERRPEIGFLWWLSAPVFVVFLLFSFKNGGGELNWPATAYLSGLVLVAGLLAEQAIRRQATRMTPHPRLVQVHYQHGWERRASAVAKAVLRQALKRDDPQLLRWHEADDTSTTTSRPRLAHLFMVTAVCLFGIGVTVAVHRSDWVRPALLRIAGPSTAERPMPLRRWDPTCRLRGWRQLATAVDELRAKLREQGIEPVLAAGRWNLPGELAFYCHGQPVVYCLGSVMGDRLSQYDLWHPNPVADPACFAGKTFILVACPIQELTKLFQRVEPVDTLVYRENDQPIAQWSLVVAHGYRGPAANCCSTITR